MILFYEWQKESLFYAHITKIILKWINNKSWHLINFIKLRFYLLFLSICSSLHLHFQIENNSKDSGLLPIHISICWVIYSFTYPSFYISTHVYALYIYSSQSSIYTYIYSTTHSLMHSLYPSIHLFIHLHTHPSFHLSSHLPVHPHIYLSSYLCTYSSIHPSIYLASYQTTHPFINTYMKQYTNASV